MDSIRTIASFISTFTTIIAQSLLFLLELSYLIGQTLVTQVLVLMAYGMQILDSTYIFLQILCNDSAIFIQDLGEKLSFMIHIVADFITCLCIGIHNGTFHFLGSLTRVFYLFASVFNTLTSLAATVADFLQNAVILFKQAILLLGSSIWLSITIIPLTITACSNIIAASVIQFFHAVQKLFLHVTQAIADCTINILSYFFDVPIDSAYGLIIGVVFLYLVTIHFKHMCAVIAKTSCKTYFYLRTFSYDLWTGRFLENSNPAVNLQKKKENDPVILPVPVLNHEEKLCVVCHDQLRNVIILPCKHLCLCFECTNQIRRVHKACPLCRGVIRRTMKVYV